MSVNLAAAAATYARNNQTPASKGLGPQVGSGGQDFAAVLRDAAEAAVERLREGEAKTMEAAAGTADINEVVMAVSKADVTLQTVVSVRDRVIQAYQDVLRMPI